MDVAVRDREERIQQDFGNEGGREERITRHEGVEA